MDHAIWDQLLHKLAQTRATKTTEISASNSLTALRLGEDDGLLGETACSQIHMHLSASTCLQCHRSS